VIPISKNPVFGNLSDTNGNWQRHRTLNGTDESLLCEVRDVSDTLSLERHCNLAEERTGGSAGMNHGKDSRIYLTFKNGYPTLEKADMIISGSASDKRLTVF